MINRIAKFYENNDFANDKLVLPKQLRKVLLNTFLRLKKGKICNFVLNSLQIQVKAHVCWEEGDYVFIKNMQCGPLHLNTKTEKAYASLIDWQSEQVMELAIQPILQSTIVKKFQTEIDRYLAFIEECEEKYQFDFIKEIWNGNI